MFPFGDKIDTNNNICCSDFMSPLWDPSYIQEFLKITTITGKVKYVEQLLIQKNCIPIAPLCIPKSNKEYYRLQNIGNKFLKPKSNAQLYHALLNFNESLCMAEHDSEEISICYANRSAICFEYNMFEKCLDNIDFAKGTGNYPSELLSQLYKLTEDCCWALLNAPKWPPHEFKVNLSHDPHSNAPNVSKYLHLKETEEYGQGVYTKDDIKPGQVLAIDATAASHLNKSSRFQRCAYCKAENQLSLIACRTCTKTMYCSSNCMKDASAVHAFECPIIDYIHTYADDVQWSMIQVTIKSFVCFDSVKQLIEFIDKFGKIRSNVLCPLSDPSITPDQQKFHQLYSLERHTFERQPNDKYRFTIFTAIVYHQLINHSPFGKICKTPEEQSILMDLLYHFYEVCAINSTNIDNTVMGLDNVVVYGSGIYPFGSLFNHSCVPNICRVFYNNNLIIIALRPIEAGEQIFDNYG